MLAVGSDPDGLLAGATAGAVVVLDWLSRLVAHVGGLSDVVNAGGVPSWLTIVTGGALVGGSFLFTSLLTDHEGIRTVNGLHALVPATPSVERLVVTGTRTLGVLGLVLVLAASVLGPTAPTQNFAILVVWVGWWAGFAMSTYLVGNTWPILNPWRTIAEALERLPGVGENGRTDASGATIRGAGTTDLPARWGAWPSVVGLLALVYVEVVSPLAERPVLLGAVVLAYTVVTLAGAVRYGSRAWFGSVDPISRVFRCYGRVAPIQRDEDGIELRLPGTGIVDTQIRGGAVAETEASATAGRPAREAGSTAFVVALLWATTFDGLVTTGPWNDLARTIVPMGVPASVLYLVALVTGFLVFRWLYRAAARRSRARVESYLTPTAIERWFVPALLPIAAGYHVAHFLGYFLSLSPALSAVLAHPLGGVGATQVATLPVWFGTVQLAFVVLGHLLAVWIAHALALEVFPGLLRPIRSQYPFVLVMVAYTMTSAWVIGQPFVDPAYL